MRLVLSIPRHVFLLSDLPPVLAIALRQPEVLYADTLGKFKFKLTPLSMHDNDSSFCNTVQDNTLDSNKKERQHRRDMLVIVIVLFIEVFPPLYLNLLPKVRQHRQKYGSPFRANYGERECLRTSDCECRYCSHWYYANDVWQILLGGVALAGMTSPLRC